MSRIPLLSVLALLAGCQAGPPEHEVVGHGLLVRHGTDAIWPLTYKAEDFIAFAFGYPITCEQLNALRPPFSTNIADGRPEGFSYHLAGFVPAEVALGESYEASPEEVLVDMMFVDQGQLDWSGGDSDAVESMRIETVGGKIFARVEGRPLRNHGRTIGTDTLAGEYDDDPREVPIAGSYELTLCDAPPPVAPPIE